ncbi:MAG TPA: adenine phosphoribosyltransferase [Candidatus Lokiarchaeia archaeon]|nr:adenine phosphoribosyltransferase [Candidatus Lokiarchaeia archaeon]
MQPPEYYEKLIRNVPDFPKPGIQFKDITPLIKDADGLKNAVEDLAAAFQDNEINKVVAIESRGFIFGAGIALKLGVGFVPIRKPGKLPAETVRMEYSLEYGTDAIEMHLDAISPGERVLIIDDLLATGGTFQAAAKIVENVGGIVAGIACVIELTESLHGRDLLEGYEVVSLVQIPVSE